MKLELEIDNKLKRGFEALCQRRGISVEAGILALMQDALAKAGRHPSLSEDGRTIEQIYDESFGNLDQLFERVLQV